MDATIFVATLIALTFGLVMAFALWSKKSVEQRKDDDAARKSTLAADAPDSR